MSAIHTEPLEELPPPATAQDRTREQSLADAMASDTVTIVDASRDVVINLDHDDRRALRALFEARARGQRVSVVGFDVLVSPQEAAGLLGVSRPMVYRLIERGDLAADRVGSHWRMRAADVLELAHRRRADLSFVSERLNVAVDEGTFHGAGTAAEGSAKSDWRALSDEEKEAALERVRSRSGRRTGR